MTTDTKPAQLAFDLDAPGANSALMEVVRDIYEDADGPIDNTALFSEIQKRTGITPERFRETVPIGKAAVPRSPLQRKIRWFQQTMKRNGAIRRAAERGSWSITDLGRKKLSKIEPGGALIAFCTDLGVAVWADCRSFFQDLGEPITLAVSSPPFLLKHKKSYGNPESVTEYVDFICSVFEPVVRWLRPGGAVALNLTNDTFEKGTPARTLCRERLVIALCERLGLQLIDQVIWSNPSKPPTPYQWASRTRQQLNSGYESVYVFSNDPVRFVADNRRVLQPHTEQHRKLIAAGGEQRSRVFSDGAHRVRHGSYSNPTAGRIPRNVLTLGHACRDQQLYKRRCGELGLPAHGAAYPVSLASFFIRWITEANDLVVDPMCGSVSSGKAAQQLGRRWICTDHIRQFLRGGAERFTSEPGFELYLP